VVRLIEHDPVMRLDSDPEGVHQARVATRRLRSDLRTFRSLVDPSLASSLRDELGWLAGVLGSVRDGDVLLERIRRNAARLPESSRPGAERVIGALAVTREDARDELFDALRSDRYVELLDLLVAAANAPALSSAAEIPAHIALPALVGDPWRLLERRAEALGQSPSDDALHDIRVRTKRVRYAAEAVAPVVGHRARAFARAAADLQEVLGDLNDAVVAEGWLREWAHGSRSPSGVFAAGELVSLERADAQRSRARWKKAWKKLASPKLRSWM
jgi:CHAD domain-containing protein